MVGDYTLLTRLGEGGMGVVHLAQRPGGERVALKVLRPHIVGDDEARARLAREVSSLSRIRSRRVAEIVDADPWADIPYVATRYVPGLSLHDQVQEQGAIDGPDLVWFASCLGEALAAVHDVGVLHRDIKPSNVLMEGRTPILIDFGLARVADDPRLTHTGWLLGTPGYLAPEILYGEDATVASDVHSWAATVAFAGLGRPPFGRGPSMAIMDRVRRGEHDLDGLDPVLRTAVEEALDPEPHRRPTLPELRDWLATLGPTPAASGPRRDDPFTVPLAVAALAVAEDRTEPATVRTPLEPGPRRTSLLPDGGTTRPLAGEPPATPWGEPVPAPRRVGGLEKLRRSVLVLGGGAVAAAGIALAPYVAVTLLVLAAWLLRSGSMAASAAGDRRRLRGTRWYDGVQLLLATPWHVVAALPGTIVLALWSAGMGAAAGLLCFAAALSLTTSLAVVGLAFALGMWWGPGGLRVRSPVRRVTHPVAARPVPWFLAAILVAAAAAGIGSVANASGTDWTPADSRPFADVELPPYLQL
jgi:hypothetical protein